jgi:dimeric dUTPase (all-alpha-NTP-PPase superfamily)
MFDMQKQLQKMVTENTGLKTDSQEFKTLMAFALSAEIHEALGETPWKPWKKSMEFNEEKYKKELIDMWAFLINMTFPVMCPRELYDRFKSKYAINIQRQKEGY